MNEDEVSLFTIIAVVGTLLIGILQGLEGERARNWMIGILIGASAVYVLILFMKIRVVLYPKRARRDVKEDWR